jgi:hypothetical protein
MGSLTDNARPRRYGRSGPKGTLMAPVKLVDNLVDISVDNFVDYFS